MTMGKRLRAVAWIAALLVAELDVLAAGAVFRAGTVAVDISPPKLPARVAGRSPTGCGGQLRVRTILPSLPPAAKCA